MVVPVESRHRKSQYFGQRIAVFGAASTVVVSGAVIVLVLLSIRDASNASAAGYVPLAWTALFILLAVLLIAMFIRRVDLRLAPGFPWIIGAVSAVAALLPWWAVAGGNPDLGTLLYRGLKIPQGIMQFWDTSVVMLSVDCARWGFDIYAENNGCMQDVSIYAPGMVWLQYVPFQVFSQANVGFLGVVMILISSLVLVWLARQSTGLGQVALLIAAVGGPWVLLLERGNIDAVVLWSAVVAVFLVRRWNTWWAWSLAAALLWLMGTWKYYPFAMGLMLLPVLRIRRGWIVLSGFTIATLGFLILTLDNVRFSLATNTAMVEYGDFVVLGRVPVVARMLGTDVGAGGWQLGDMVVLAVGLLAAVWGAGVGLSVRRDRTWMAMLGIAGTSMYLVSVVVSGFGYGYKATFLLLLVPLIAALLPARQRLIVASALAVLLLVVVQSVVVWNTVLATTSGVIAAGFGFGLSASIIARSVRRRSKSR